MCGICGIIDSKLIEEKRKELVQKMNNAILHRGPDEDGTLSDLTCSLGMRRLSIIDLSSGKQPIYNEDKSLCIFFNGEIYNYKELRKRLINNGHTFRTSSDTETVLHLYEEKGERTPSFLKGMFALCIYDLKKKKWFFSRDRFGEKPFFYYFKDGHFSFSSEIKSLLEDEKIDKVLNKKLLPYYLSSGFIPEPNTLIKDILSLPPGHNLILENNQIKISEYFKVHYKVDQSLKTEQDCIEYLDPIFTTAIKRQMISDVPIGAFLSGGIDSSTIVAYMQSISNEPIKTFTVKFEEAKYDESPIAREVANHLGTNHTEVSIPNATFTEDVFWNILDKVGFPFVDTSAIPTYFISQEIRKHVTVALSGDGGDELFAGYPVYQWWPKIERLNTWPNSILNIGANVSDFLSKLPLSSIRAKGRQANKAFSIALNYGDKIGFGIHRLFDAKQIQKLFPDSGVLNFDLAIDVESKEWTPFNKAMFYRLKQTLPMDMLIKVDRMSMANSLEVRAPFLDPDLFEASTKLNPKFLIKNGSGKHIVKCLMKDRLPDSVFNHPKKGFSLPLFSYMNDAFTKLAYATTVNNEKLTQLFDNKELFEILEKGLSQKTDEVLTAYQVTHQLWALMQLGGWMKKFDIKI